MLFYNLSLLKPILQMSEQSKNSNRRSCVPLILNKIAAKHHIFKHNSVTCVQMTIYLLQLELVFSDILIEMGYCYDGLSLYFYITSKHMFRAEEYIPPINKSRKISIPHFLQYFQNIISCTLINISMLRQLFMGTTRVVSLIPVLHSKTTKDNK